MKKFRLLFILALIIVTCTGCTVEYNINITENNIEESIYVTDYISSNRNKNDILDHYNIWYPTYVDYIPEGEIVEIDDFSKKIDGIEYHQKNMLELNNGYKYTYNYTYPIQKYYNSLVLANSFADTTVYKRSNSLVLKTSDESFLCDYNYFEEAKINITIDPEIYKLNYTNAENQKNNTYIWTIDRNDCNNSEIILTLDIINNSNDNEINGSNNINDKSNSSIDNYIIYIFFGILALIIYFGYNWFQKFKENNNNID